MKEIISVFLFFSCTAEGKWNEHEEKRKISISNEYLKKEKSLRKQTENYWK